MGRTTFTLKERQEREDRVYALLKAGKTNAEIAKEIGVTPQAMSQFLQRRGWVARTKRNLPPLPVTMPSPPSTKGTPP